MGLRLRVPPWYGEHPASMTVSLYSSPHSSRASSSYGFKKSRGVSSSQGGAGARPGVPWNNRNAALFSSRTARDPQCTNIVVNVHRKPCLVANGGFRAGSARRRCNFLFYFETRRGVLQCSPGNWTTHFEIPSNWNLRWIGTRCICISYQILDCYVLRLLVKI